MLDIGSWYLTMFDKPMFQFAQGIVIGVLIMGAIWALCSCLKAEKCDSSFCPCECNRCDNEEADDEKKP